MMTNAKEAMLRQADACVRQWGEAFDPADQVAFILPLDFENPPSFAVAMMQVDAEDSNATAFGIEPRPRVEVVREIEALSPQAAGAIGRVVPGNYTAVISAREGCHVVNRPYLVEVSAIDTGARARLKNLLRISFSY